MIWRRRPGQQRVATAGVSARVPDLLKLAKYSHRDGCCVPAVDRVPSPEHREDQGGVMDVLERINLFVKNFHKPSSSL